MTTHTSSIGPQWPPEKASYGRIKGIDNRGRIEGPAELADLLGRLTALKETLEPLILDRISIRALVSNGLLAEHPEMFRPWGEALIPLEGCGSSLEDVALVYLGGNGESRATDSNDLERCLKNVATAESRDARSASAMIDRARDGGYAVRILGEGERRTDAGLHGSMAELYSRFGWSPDETREILANPSSLIAIAEHEGQPVSAGIAELSHIAFQDGHQLRMAEFTEAATRASHQGKGLYSAIVATLSRELAERSRAGQILGGELNVAFGECSGHDLGVLIAAKHLGRCFSRRVCRDRGLAFEGFLPQHVPIAGAPRSTPYNDLFPTFLSRDTLYAFAVS